MMGLLLSKELSFESSNKKPLLLFANLKGLMSTSPSDDMAEAKGLSLAMSMPT